MRAARWGRPIAAALAALAGAWAGAASNLRQPPSGADASYDSKSFLVGEQRRLILCGGLHYFRIPPEDWRSRLLLTRLAGFNMVETPVPWGLHQPTRDEWRLDGPADLPRFLDLCHEAGLLAFIRIGPYVNAALSHGGLPHWLGEDPKLLVRSANDRFIEAVKPYWAKLLPILAARQVPDGPVALVQVEDNYQGPDSRYLSRLYDEVRAAGFRVPIVLSHLNPCRDFQRLAVPDTEFFATTELLPEGPLLWGERRKPADGFGDLLMEGLAKGVDGFNHSMWAAGTNLALLPGSGFPTRFEAGTSGILESGGLSPVFAQAKSANWFARAFEGLLTQSTSLREHPILSEARRAGLVAYGRTDGRSALIFLKRRIGEGLLAVKDPTTGEGATLPTSATQFRHVVLGHPVTPRTTLAFSTAQVFAVAQPPPAVARRRRVIVVYAPAGAEAVMVFNSPEQPKVRAGAEGFTWNDKAQQLVLRWRCAARGERKVFAFEGDAPIQVIALEEGLLPLAWVLEGAGVLVGPASVGEWTSSADKASVELRLPARRVQYALSFYPFGPLAGLAAAKGVSDVRHDPAAGSIECRLDLEVMEPLTVFLRQWETAEGMAEAAPGFDDAAWRETVRPEPLGQGHHGWYRCRINATKASTRKLIIENLADSATVFLNGQCVGQSTTKRLVDGPRAFPHTAQFDLPLKPGENLLAILAKNWGSYRNTAAYGVPLASSSGWGILGSVSLDGQPPGRWRQRDGLEAAGRTLAWAPFALKPGAPPPKFQPQDARPQAPVRWFRTTFAPRKHPARLAPRVHLKGLSHGVMWLNGRYVGLYSLAGAEAGQGIVLPTAWLREGGNELIILEEGGQQPTEGEVRFDRDGTFLPFRIEYTAQPSPPAPLPKGRPRP